MYKTVFVASLLACGLSLATPGVWGADNRFLDDTPVQHGPRPATTPPVKGATPVGRAPAPAPVLPGGKAAAPAGQADLVPAVRGLPPDPGDVGTYRIAVGDLLQVRVFQVEELSGEERVNQDGQIVLPLIGPTKVAGLTPKEAEARVAAALGREYLENPQVDLFVKEATGQKLTVLGSVKKPGVFPIGENTTLIQAIALAEGTDPLAAEGEVIVFRADSGRKVLAYVVDLGAIKKGELPDPVLIGGDRVVVPQSGTAVFLKNVSDTLRGFINLRAIP